LGGDYFDKLNPERTAQRLLVGKAKLRFEVEIRRRPVPAVAPVEEAIRVLKCAISQKLKPRSINELEGQFF